MNATELHVNRRNTDAFIQSNPHTIALVPRTKVKTPTGGTTWQEGRPRQAQIFRMVENGGTALAAGTGRVPGGSMTESDFVLLGSHDAVIGEHDIFKYRGDQWEVVELLWHNGYETRARVRRYGG